MGVSDADFTSAKDRVGTLSEDPGNEVKLKMYALFKQVIKGGNVQGSVLASNFAKQNIQTEHVLCTLNANLSSNPDF